MVLSGNTIRQSKIITPFHERTVHQETGTSYGLSYCGYDVRIDQQIDLEPGRFALGSLIERIAMPANLVGIVHDKSTWARVGIALQNTVVEPGWRGHLTVEISNHGHGRVRIPAGSPIAQILFHLSDAPCTPYRGKYQDQPAKPVPAIFETV